MVDSTLINEIQQTTDTATLNLTQEEIDGIQKYKEQLEKRRAYQREWMANRRKTDPDFAAKQRAMTNRRKKERYATDETYRNKELEYNRSYVAEKNKYKELYEKVSAELK